MSKRKKQSGRSVVLMPTGTRAEVRIALAAMTEAERKRIVPPGITGAARESFIKHGLSLADQIGMAERKRLAEEAVSTSSTNDQEVTVSSTITAKSIATEIGTSAKRVRKLAAQLELTKPFTQRDQERIAARLLAQTQPTSEPASEPVAQPRKRTRKGQPTQATTQVSKRAASGVTPAQLAEESGQPATAVRKFLRHNNLNIKKGSEGWSLTRKQADKVVAALQA
jgi:hypothetical protein